jgi:hypothetical protein
MSARSHGRGSASHCSGTGIAWIDPSVACAANSLTSSPAIDGLRRSASRIARPVLGSVLGRAPGEDWLGLRASAVQQHRGVQSRRGTNHNCSGTSERGDDEYRGGWRGRGDRCTLICVRRRGRVSVRWTMGRVGEEHGGDGSLGAEWRPRGAGNVSPLDVPQRCGGLVAESDG